MNVSQKDVCVVVLCYGDRLENLKDTLDALERNNPGKILLVGNAVSQRVGKEIEQRVTECSSRYCSVTSRINLGSAGGYALGIETALGFPEYDFLWLLDDDNCPQDHSLEALLACWESAPAGSLRAVVAHRKTQAGHSKAATEWNEPTPREGSCVGFHFLNLIFKRHSNKSEPSALPWTAYGGLLIPADLTRKIGFPRRDFFLYGDDLEWTLRITWAGGKIIPCPEAEIIDLCPSWNMIGGKGSNLRRRIRDLESFRVYYEVRNRTWIARQYFQGYRPVYFINRTLFILIAGLMAFRYRRLNRFRLLRRAIRDGERSVLGQMPTDLLD